MLFWLIRHNWQITRNVWNILSSNLINHELIYTTMYITLQLHEEKDKRNSCFIYFTMKIRKAITLVFPVLFSAIIQHNHNNAGNSKQTFFGAWPRLAGSRVKLWLRWVRTQGLIRGIRTWAWDFKFWGEFRIVQQLLISKETIVRNKMFGRSNLSLYIVLKPHMRNFDFRSFVGFIFHEVTKVPGSSKRYFFVKLLNCY